MEPRVRAGRGSARALPLALAALLLLAPATLAQGGKKNRQRPQNPAKQAAPAKPPAVDPATEADRVTLEAEHERERSAEKDSTLHEHFRLCDLDANDWISFREAGATLGIERDEFRRYDSSQDGRVDFAEFAARSKTILELLGATEPVPPMALGARATGSETPAGARREPVSVAPADLLARSDADRSGALEGPELAQLFSELGVKLTVAQVLEKLDGDRSGGLDETELVRLSTNLESSIPAAGEGTSAGDPTSSASGAGADRAPGRAPLIPGPVRHFRRLDLGNDGAIDESDLRACLAGSRMEVRLAGVLGALDRDGDRRLTEAEFLAALGDPSRP